MKQYRNIDNMHNNENQNAEEQVRTAKYYLLVRGNYFIPDGDEFVGIYSDIEKLKCAYLAENKKLEEMRAAGQYPNYGLLIYEFYEGDQKQENRIVNSKDLWRENI